MPFRIEYSDQAFADFNALRPQNIPPTRKLIGSFPHDRWLIGGPSSDYSQPDLDVREMRNGPITLVYELDHANEVVRLLRILAVAD